MTAGSNFTISNTLCDIESSNDIRLLVNTFYEKILGDGLVGPIFEQVIDDWESHLPRMYRFWEKLLFRTGDFQGNPFQKHLKLSLERDHFTRWVEIFIETVDALFKGAKAEEAKRFANNISTVFQKRMGMIDEGFAYGSLNYIQ